MLHPDDAVANKMGALYDARFARDFIDIDAAPGRAAYDRASLLALAERSDIAFDRRVFADALAQAQLLDPDDFAQYGSPASTSTACATGSPSGARTCSTTASGRPVERSEPTVRPQRQAGPTRPAVATAGRVA